MSKLIKVEGYRQLLDPIQTELGIKQIKDFFQANLSTALRLRRVTAPLFVLRGLGLNDDLSGAFPCPVETRDACRIRHTARVWTLHRYECYSWGRGVGQHPLPLR